jgi:ABC-type multidrug transport system permease subunit
VFITVDESSPAWVLWVGRIFPVKHLVDGMRDSYLGIGFHWSDVAVLALWAAIGVVVAVRTFKWEPGR